MIAPAAGPTTKIQNPVHSPPTSAGPSERAGFREQPSTGMIAKWIATRASGIATRAPPLYRSLFVEWRITSTKIAVNTISTKIDAPFPCVG